MHKRDQKCSFHIVFKLRLSKVPNLYTSEFGAIILVDIVCAVADTKKNHNTIKPIRRSSFHSESKLKKIRKNYIDIFEL